MNRNQVLPQIELSSDPKALKGVDFLAPQTYHGKGFLNLQDIPRVAAEAAQIEAGDGFDWEIQTFFDAALAGDPRQKMQFKLSGRLHLVCQTCMQPCLVQIGEEWQFIFVADEAEADAFPMDDDGLEPLVGSAHFDLLATIEDEILLSLPLIPKHSEGVCAPVALAFPSGVEGGKDADWEERPENPFNVLKNMKKNS